MVSFFFSLLLMDLDPKKNPHLRPQLNPFSIFGGSESVPDIFEEETLSKPVPRASKTVAPASVPAMDVFSLTPAGDKKKTKQTSSSLSSASSSSVASSVSLPPPPSLDRPPPPQQFVSSSLPGAHEDDDSFFEDETALPPVMTALPPTVGAASLAANVQLEKRLAELELRVAQSNVELVSAREQVRKMQSMLEQEAASKRMLEEEVRQLNIKLVNQKKKEADDNKALEAALLAIEAKLQAANARAKVRSHVCLHFLIQKTKDAESELAAMRANQANVGVDGEDLVTVKKKLARAHRAAANMSLEFGEATQKSGTALKEMMTTMHKLTALLSSFEKISVE